MARWQQMQTQNTPVCLQTVSFPMNSRPPRRMQPILSPLPWSLLVVKLQNKNPLPHTTTHVSPPCLKSFGLMRMNSRRPKRMQPILSPLPWSLLVVRLQNNNPLPHSTSPVSRPYLRSFVLMRMEFNTCSFPIPLWNTSSSECSSLLISVLLENSND
ncbi:uncharacterized protein LOC116585999 isoform X2 [Mustela erminea]|uniref:uncharacterized protein LOC116585999 isoform X2 n=1 Tax=Mustela erminea TaxID=36723 RepID=UPI001386A25D|nr:uncharacterized protein LOC116585999 isoform X2 [Mustela erminea]